MSPDIKDLDDYLVNGNSNNVSDLKNNNNSESNSNSDSTHNNNNNPSCSINLDASHIERIERNSSPASGNSQNISIVSLDDNDIDSSIASDSDFDDDFPPKDARYIMEKLAHGAKSSDIPHNDGVIIVSQKQHDEVAAASRPHIDSIAVQNSSDITFGNKTFYQGPVTIKQFLLDNNRWRPSSGENDNPIFQNSNGSINNPNPIDSGDKKNSTTSKPKEPVTFKILLKKYKKYIIINVVGLVLLLVFIIGLMFALRSGSTKIIQNTGDGDQNVRENKDSHIGVSLPHSVTKLRLITRDEWIAQPPDKILADLVLPINRVIITHTATEGCDSQAQCIYRVRNIQTYHMESRGWDDIGYNFLVGGDGAVYEGRGWNKQGAHTKGYNDGSIGIAFIGTFTKRPPPQRQFDALKLILEEGVVSGKLTEDYKIYPHRAFFGTESPGEKIIDVIKTWPHYTPSLV